MKQLLDIGQTQEVFKPSLVNMLAGVTIGGLMMWGANFVWQSAYFQFRTTRNLRWYKEKGASWTSIILFCVIALVLLAGGLALIYWMWRQRSLRVYFGEKGFLQRDSKQDRIFLWQDIIQVDEVHLFEAPPVLTGGLKNVLPKVKSISYLVYRKDDEIPFAASGNTLKKHKRFGGMLRQHIEEFDVEWRIVEQGK